MEGKSRLFAAHLLLLYLLFSVCAERLLPFLISACRSLASFDLATK